MNMKQDWIVDIEDMDRNNLDVLHYEIVDLLEEARGLHTNDDAFREWLDTLLDSHDYKPL